MEFVMLHYRGWRIRFVGLLSLALLPVLVEAGVLTDILVAKLVSANPRLTAAQAQFSSLPVGR